VCEKTINKEQSLLNAGMIIVKCFVPAMHQDQVSSLIFATTEIWRTYLEHLVNRRLTNILPSQLWSDIKDKFVGLAKP
jgi:hypothetical protein